MKKILFLFLFSVGSTFGFAQGFYIRMGLGYAFPQAAQTLDGTATPYNGTLNNTTQAYDMKGASFSAGLQGAVAAGYMFSGNVGIQLDANIGIAPKKYTFTADNVDFGGGVSGSVSQVQQASTPFMLIPALVVQSGGDKINFYSRLGLALPLNTKITEDQVQTYGGGSAGALTVDDYNLTIKNSFSLGFAGAAGIQYNLSDRVSLWGEVTILSMSAYIKQVQLTAVSENGQSVPLSAVSGAQTVNYSKHVTVDSSGANQATYSQPFSNVGINVGIRFNLSKNGGRHSGKRNDDDIDGAKPYRRR